MMDWFKQSQDMMSTWMDTQRQMMDSMARNMMGTETKPADNWQQTVKGWENAYKNMVETQALMTRMWARNMMAMMPSDTSDQFTQAVESMTQTWTQMQQTLIDSWFMMLKSMNPMQMNEQMQSQSQRMMTEWQDNMQKMMTMQSEWTQNWMKTMMPGSESETA